MHTSSLSSLAAPAAQGAVAFPAPDPVTPTCRGTEIIAQSPNFRHVLAQAGMVAPTDCTVLVQGETGTGKEIVAEYIHYHSPRLDHALIKINCAAIPAGLLESELFGHERGAFTGAMAQRIGRFEMAENGTLFLDEVGDIPLESQPKLLRVLQEQAFERLGGTRTVHTHVRLIAATHRNLGEMAAEGKFRVDLLYRLNVFPVTLPPLRERVADIPPLVRHFTRHYAQKMNRRIDEIPEPVMASLMNYAWPGNVRELQNFIERSVILSRGTALESPVSELVHLNHQVPAQPVTMKDAERAHILRTLERTNGQLAGAALLLGLPRSTLFYRIRRLGITFPRPPKGPKLDGEHRRY